VAVQFILGRAGTGKSSLMFRQIKERLTCDSVGSPSVYLVPEQATFQAEYALAAREGMRGMIGGQVLSFGRMAYRLLQELGGNTLLPIDDLGKQMVLRMLLERHRDQFALFHRSAGQPGFIEQLARMISECKSFGITPEQLAEQDWGNGTLGQKLHDLRLLIDAYDQYLTGTYYDTEEMLARVTEKVKDSAYIRESEIWIDGFSGFTRQELRMIGQLMKHARQVTIALCLDPAELHAAEDELALFHPTAKTYQQLVTLAVEEGVTLQEPICLHVTHRFSSSPQLSHLERQLFRWEKGKQAPEAARPEEVTLSMAANRRAEVETVALRILALAREEGYRWREMAVLLRDIGLYADEIAHVFTDYGIPYFLDQKRAVLHHPLIELVRSALETVAARWRYEPLFRTLKTDLVVPQELTTAEARAEIDLLENYVLAYGIQWPHWSSDAAWSVPGQEEQGFADMDAIRRRYAAPLLALDQELNQAAQANVRAMSEALYHFLIALQVPQKLETWQRQAEAEGNLTLAQEHGQVWNGLLAVLDQIVEVMGEETLDVSTYARILDSGLESLRLGLVPPSLDQVLIGSLERSRQPEVKAVFVLGVNEGIIPKRHTEDGILDETERERLAAAGLELAPSARQRLLAEQYLLYQAITRPTEQLWLSCALADEEGKALLPSPVLERVRETLPDAGIRFFANEPTGVGDDDRFLLGRPAQVFRHLLTLLRQMKKGTPLTPFWWEVYDWFVQHSSQAAREKWLLSGLTSNNRVNPLPPETSVALYGTELKMSVSRLERFQACPFSHFASHGIRLSERQLYRLERVDVGELFHASLKRAVEKIREAKLDWGGLSESGSMRLAEEVVDEIVPETRSNILQRTARYRFLTGKLKRAVGRAIHVLGEHARRSRFAPIGLEVSFGPQGELPGLTMQLNDQLSLQLIGRIDRVDRSLDTEELYLRIIDYKSGPKKLALSDIWNGTNLQLLVYLDVVLSHAERWLGQKAEVGGVFYYQVADPFIPAKRLLTVEEAAKQRASRLKMKGLLLADPHLATMMDTEAEGGSSDLLPFAFKKDGSFTAYSSVATADQFRSLQSHVRRTVKELTMRMTAGEIAVSPFAQGMQIACQTCSFKPVCHFDPVLEGNEPRIFNKLNDGQIWELLQQAGGETP